MAFSFVAKEGGRLWLQSSAAIWAGRHKADIGDYFNSGGCAVSRKSSELMLQY